MSNQERGALFWVKRPEPRAHAIPYQAPAPDANPVVRGLPLYYGAAIVSRFNFIQSFLWRNAGFDRLRDKPELDNVEPRYEPTVIKTNGQPIPALDFNALLNESWETKRQPSSFYPSVLDYHEAFKSGSLTPSALVETLLPLVCREVPNANPHSTAFLQTRVDLVRQAAAASTKRYAAGTPISPLDGIPVAVKDEQDITGYNRSLGSKINYTDPNDATSFSVQQWQQAGAVVLGKTNMHELGMDTTNNNPVFGTPLNPHNDRYYCGGSSGGSGYVVAAGLTPVAMGVDGGGSIRIPSAYCGIFGLKTSHGRVSNRPTANDCKSTTVTGPMAANMVDLEIAYRLLSQPDPQDQDGKLFVPPAQITPNDPQRPRVLGISRTWLDRADANVKDACQRAIDHLTTHSGYSVVEIDIPLPHDGQLAHAMTILSEAIASTPVSKQRSLNPANQILLSIARHTPAGDLMQAQKLRNLLLQHLSHLYTTYPGLIIVTPTTPDAGHFFNPADLRYGVTDGNKEIRSMEYVWLANFAGCPAISVPVGYVEPEVGSGKIPVGLMGMGEWCAEDGLLGFGYDVEKYLYEGVVGGRQRPGNMVNPLLGVV